MAEAEPRDWEKLCELIWGCAIGQAIHVAVKLGIPPILANGPRSADQLASDTGADPWALETVLRVLAAHEIVSREGDEQYGLAPMGKLLLRSAAGSQFSEADEFYETIYRPLGALVDSVRTGEVAFDRAYGESFYDYLGGNPELSVTFFDMMAANAPQRYSGLSSLYDFSSVSRVVDVGGGEGSLLVQILLEHPDLSGVLFDLPMLAARAAARIESAGLSARCEVAFGDFRNSVPCGGDLYIVAQVLNNWRDGEAQQVLANCRSAMDARARLLVLEPVYLSGQPLSRWSTLVSLGVMAQRGGRTRSETQLRSLIAAAGFQVESLRQSPFSATCAIQAKPIVL